MTEFRRLMQTVLLAGVLSGLALFALQHFTIVPLILQAETYEDAARRAMPGMAHEDEGWQPGEGLERTAFTAAGTALTAIGFAAVLFGVAACLDPIDGLRSGLLWGVAGFVCVSLAPALGQPPQPPGAAVADLHSRQLWWAAAVLAAGVGLFLLTRRELNSLLRLSGIVVFLGPLLVGAPQTNELSLVPQALSRRFAIASLLTDAVFWILLGVIAGFLFQRRSNVANALD